MRDRAVELTDHPGAGQAILVQRLVGHALSSRSPSTGQARLGTCKWQEDPGCSQTSAEGERPIQTCWITAQSLPPGHACRELAPGAIVRRSGPGTLARPDVVAPELERASRGTASASPLRSPGA